LFDGLWPLVGKSLFFDPVNGRLIGRGRPNSLAELASLDTALRGPAPRTCLDLIRLRRDVSEIDTQIRETSGEDHGVFDVALRGEQTHGFHLLASLAVETRRRERRIASTVEHHLRFVLLK